PNGMGDADDEGAGGDDDGVDDAEGDEGRGQARDEVLGFGTAAVEVHQLVRHRAGDEGAAAEAHDRQAGGQSGAVREPFHQRRHRRDVADAQTDSADDAVAEVDQPQLTSDDAEGG